MNISSGLILLTYKGKILLTHKNTNPTLPNFWSFLGLKSAEKETSVKLKSVELLESDSYKSGDSFYHATLSDDNVNNIKRNEGQTLNFFTLKEIKKLSLTTIAQEFLEKHEDFLQNNQN